ncbi:MAG: IS66 family insertion sequence element accessory protein TnpB [Bacteroidales bacterium]|nr:IS66 family insertion sequence element accessory protein TnpB [Candidatus Hennigimonas equi]
MLTISGLRNFYFIPEFTDMRCKAPRVLEIVHRRFGREPYDGDVFIFMSRNRKKLRMVHFEDNAYYLHEKSFVKGYRYMRVEYGDDGRRVCRIDWKDLVALLHSPVIDTLRITGEEL